VSLSVLCVTGDAPARVAPILGLLRPVADEIVVVVPALDPDDACDAYGGAADRVVRAPADMPGTLLAWACSLCREDWIMPIGEDEVPSRALVDALPSLLARDDVLQYHIPRRSLYPVPGRWLDSHPWSSEYRIRVVRNDRLVEAAGHGAGLEGILAVLDPHLEPWMVDRGRRVVAGRFPDPLHDQTARCWRCLGDAGGRNRRPLGDRVGR